MCWGNISIRYHLVCFILFFGTISVYSMTEVTAQVSIISKPSQQIALTVRKSTILSIEVPVGRVSLAEPEIADALVLKPQQIYVTGKKSGMTNLTLWDNKDRIISICEIEVLPEIQGLKEQLHVLFPHENDIQVTATNRSVTLSGTVSGTAVLSKILDVARSYAPLDKDGKLQLNNLLEVGGVQQVMLEVRISEMSRNLIRRLGFNFGFLSSSGQQFGVSMLNSLARVNPGGGPGGAISNSSDKVNMIFRFLGGGASWTVFIDALKEEGLLRILAEPTLITLSGKAAYFLAGGEFPVPVPQTGGGGFATITIQWKPFGVGLNFTPTVLSNNKISMEVSPEVSELDFSKAIVLRDFTIPAISTRRVSTVVELADGQSFAIAGLLNDEYRQNVRKYPLLGDIPILGMLFRSSDFEKSETELVVIVTTHLVKPLDKTKQSIPTDKYIEPNDFEFYLLGCLEGRGSKTGTSTVSPYNKKGGLEGDFGYMLP